MAFRHARLASDVLTDPAVIAQSVRRLIAAHIVSVEQLEVLLLLREHRDRSWTVEQVNDRISSSPSSVASRLVDLERRGFVRHDGTGFRYQGSTIHETALTELAAAYAERKYSVIELIFARATEKLRAFADAFRVRRGDDDG